MIMPFPGNDLLDFSGGKLDDVSRNRIIMHQAASANAGNEHFLMSGGIYQFLDYCPSKGCIAVEFTRSGELVHAYPYRPDQFEKNEIVSLPYEQVFFRFSNDAHPIGILKLPGGDIIVTFQQWATFPYGGGIARVRPDGSVVWYRHDYSHHWPSLLPNGDIVALGMRLGKSTLSTPLAGSTDVSLSCNGKIIRDIIRVINPSGHVIQELPVFDALLHSPYRGMLIGAADPCDPVHTNYVVPVTQGIRALYPDVDPDDLLISMRNINAFAILGRHDDRIKHLFTGTFLRQHSVQPIGQSASLLIFDNHGAGWHGGPSRFLAYNLADHQERTILPNASAPRIAIYSTEFGDIAVSPDATRAIVASSLQGRAYEVRLADNTVLTEFNDIHDLRKVPQAGEERNRAAARFALYTIGYVH